MEDKLFFEEEEIQESFKVTDLNSANWCMRKMRANEKKLAEYKELAKAEIERINAWLKKEAEKIDNSNSFFQVKLEEYFLEQRANDPKFKLSTPYGKMSTRKQHPKWYYDEDKLLSYLKESNKAEFIRTKEEIDKAKLKKSVSVKEGRAVTEDGEIIECITIEEQPDKITIKLEG